MAPSEWDPKLPRQAANSTNALMDPPVSIPDPYGWLRDDKRENEEMLDYLKAENSYTQSMTRHLQGLQEDLYKEFLSSLQETDHSTPRPWGEWWYYTRTYKGSPHATYCRSPKTSDSLNKMIDWDGSKDSPILPGEQVYLDVNVLAKNQSYCNVGFVASSPSQELLAYSIDYSGAEDYEVHIRNLTSGHDFALKKTGPSGEGGLRGKNDDLLTSDDFTWGKDEKTFYYTTADSAHRTYRLYERKNWDSEDFTDALLMEEKDHLFSCSVDKSFDEKYIFYGTSSKDTSEVWYIDLSTDADDAEMKCVSPRRTNVLYDVESHDGRWYISTNFGNSTNMKLMTAPAKPNSLTDWKLVEDGDGDPVFDGSLVKSLDSFTAFKTHAVLEGREDGIPRVWTYSFETNDFIRLEFDDAAYVVGLSTNYEIDAANVAYEYSSMLAPPSTIEISLNDDSQRSVLKTQSVPGYDNVLYGTDRLEVLSRDGKTQIPISVVYHKDTMGKVKDGERVPVHLYGYGSYGESVDANFDSTRLPLLKRGMIYVIAHIRGGGEMGQQWYEEPNGAKLLCKENTFNDFVDVAHFLVENWTIPQMLSCEGRSAGGLLIGASINQAPELFRVAILGVPFVDVAVTMTDSSIPLTSGEWIEWGNPNEEKYFQYMMDYSPMNNVQEGKTYPACWVTGGLHDPRVAYWEPSKFTATLRHSNPNNEHPVCMKLDLHQGHFSSSDRYKFYRELASDYSFLLDQLG
eukprot:CAMPEP_0172298280 /NCGR_PEP_ID=MMETSP1058-20130122/1010_1 /TAXON_ID=83371 /ORGANISM="Detonula confervacea, Strain CCMP 353" /LENGTH=739 /DNA_ID=CAMNT_0013007543 /DNA_START=470 /DNA_END=2686 /DNA_ORIENTATION=-